MTTVLDAVEVAVGDRVWCLARVGTPYTVAFIDDQTRTVVLEPAETRGAARRLTLPHSALWLVTKQQWDQIWYWPDRCGESYEQVVARFAGQHAVGDVVTGYYFDRDVPLRSQGFITPDPTTAMRFRVHENKSPFPTIPVEPVVEVGGDLVSAGPVVPLRLGMTAYRWSLAFGELVVNWQDFLPVES